MVAAAEPRRTVIGPTWRRGENGKFVLPERTLGWQVIDWCEAGNVLQPDGPNAGDPWRFTLEQARFVLWWYAVDEQGRFIYRAGMLRRMKGWGKDPLAAVLCIVEFVGPCRFGGWDVNGQPIAEPVYASCVLIAAVSQDQVKRNTMSLFPGLLSPALIRECEMDVGKEIIYAIQGRCRIEMLTTSARSTEGPRPTFILKNETQHWVKAVGGPEMAATCRRNAAKARDGSTRMLSISNAHAPGEMSDAELDYEAYLERPGSFLYDSIESSDEVISWLRRLKEEPGLEDAEKASLRENLIGELRWCRGDSDWVHAEILLEECEDPRTPVNMALRFYFNRLAAGEDRAFNAGLWDELERRGYRPERGALVVGGFDGSVNRDHTALIGMEVATGHQFVAGYWEPALQTDGQLQIPVNEVVQTLDAFFEEFEVWRLNADPWWWKEVLAALAGRHNEPSQQRVVEFDTTQYKRMARALRNYRDAMEGREISHDGDERFRAGIVNAHRHELQFLDDDGERMWTIQKERPDSPFKIDPAMAGALANEARLAAIAAGVLEPEPPSPYEAHGLRRA